jgi:ABC-type multidrug transport system fused ATPase/permease subunit
MFRRFLPLLRPYRSRLALGFAATLAQPALSAVRIWLLKVLIDSVVAGHQTGLLLAVCVGYLAIAAAKGLSSVADNYLGGWVGARVVRDLRAALYDHLQGLSLRFYHGQRLGDLLTRLTGDISAIEDLLVAGLTDLVAQSLTIVVFLGMLFYLNASLALVSLAVLPVLAAVSVNYARQTRSAQVDVREWASALTSVAEEGLSAIALVKAFAREAFERGRFSETTQAGLGARLRSIRLRALYTPLVDILATIGTILVVWFGVQAVWSGQLSLGGLVVFLGYLGSVYAPVQAITRLVGVVQRARVGAERVAEVLDAPLAVRERRGGSALGPVRGLVEFRAVTFGYTPERPVLRGFDLTIRPGEMVALVGPSGVGKTTVVSLLLNYYDADSGVLAIDGRDVRHFDPPAVREQIAAVLQEPMLFNTSVRDNLRYGRLDASDAEIEEAARAAQAHAFICELPDGYETSVGPRGARLSGGQRQRLAIARALVKAAPIVVLDEATSALDPATEAAVLDGLRTRLAGSSVLLVAHRPSTIRHADRVVALERGRVIDARVPPGEAAA